VAEATPREDAAQPLMTTAVFYLFVVYHPQGPFITDVFGVKLEYWKSEIREHGFSFRIPGR
jgi:hypothetical protein